MCLLNFSDTPVELRIWGLNYSLKNYDIYPKPRHFDELICIPIILQVRHHHMISFYHLTSYLGKVFHACCEGPDSWLLYNEWMYRWACYSLFQHFGDFSLSFQPSSHFLRNEPCCWRKGVQACIASVPTSLPAWWETCLWSLRCQQHLSLLCTGWEV